MKKTKTQELEEIANEIKELFNALPEDHPVGNQLSLIIVENGRLKIRYKQFWKKEKSLTLEIAKKWLELFKEKPQFHYEAERLIKNTKKIDKQKMIKEAPYYFVIKNENIVKLKFVSKTSKFITLFDLYDVKYPVDDLNKRIFDSEVDANKKLKEVIKNTIISLEKEIDSLKKKLETLN